MKKMLLAALLAAPGMAFAAGFANSSLFLSKNPVTEGEAVLLYAVVQNDTQEPFSGSLKINEGDTTLGSLSVELKSGEARTLSLSWAPKAGSHTITATLMAKNGDRIADEKETFIVNEKPKPQVKGASTESGEVESSAQIQESIGSVSPAVEHSLAPLFSTLDSWRQSGATFLDKQVASAKGGLPKGSILGAEVVSEAQNNPTGSVVTVFKVLYFYLLTFLRAIIASAILFYPLLLMLIIWLLWNLYLRMSRPRFS